MERVDLFQNSQQVNCKPFLRWAGGKNWLTKYIHNFIPKSGFKAYHEPFLGGGALFFHLHPSIGYLSDMNSDLIETYRAVKNNVYDVLTELKRYNNTEKEYYIIRDREYRSKVKKAAQFIYLNQTSFNGIYRVNLKGKYNVPYGFRNKDFIQEKNLKLASKALKNTILSNEDFEITIKKIKKNDLVFLDPPYTVSHNNNGFIKYNQKLFSIDDQYRLSNFIDKIKSKGAYYILTNAAHKKIEEIFYKEDSVYELSRANLIGGTNAKRGKIKEFLFTNVNLEL